MRALGDPLSRSVWRWQLMLAVSVVVIAGVSALLTPDVFANWRFVLALSVLVVVTAITLGLRWERLGTYSVLALAIFDILVIWVLHLGALTPIVFLWVFPIAWIATYYRTSVLISALTLLALLMLAEFAAAEVTDEGAVQFIMLLITLGFVGTMSATGSRRNRSTRRLLRAQARRVELSLQRVTEQKSRTQRLLDSLDLGIAQVGSDGMLQLVNSRFQELYAFEKQDHFGSARAVEYTERRGTPVPRARTLIARAAGGELFVNEVVWLFGVDGVWRALRASTRQMENERSAGDGLLLIVEEITTEVDPLARRGETMRKISHELRNPLTAVLGHVDLLLERDDLHASAREQAEVIERAGERMQVLIDRALRTESSDSVDGDMYFDLVDPLRASVEAFGPAADAQKVRILVHGDESVPLTGDVFRIRQVIDNMLSNAIKYSHRGSSIHVETSLRDGEACIEVSDSGIGIAQEDLSRIFDGDFRAQSALDAKVPGTGLGLSISREIAAKSGGSLTVHSELGQGTTVRFTIPTHGRKALT